MTRIENRDENSPCDIFLIETCFITIQLRTGIAWNFTIALRCFELGLDFKGNDVLAA